MIAASFKLRISCFAIAVLLVAVAISVERTDAREGSETRQRSAGAGRVRENSLGEKGTHRLREGTIVTDQSGFFREDGDGATFVSDAGMELGALPNLNLERIVRLLKNAEEPSSVRWSVTGKVTEFSGRNFLLISRAIYKSSAPPPVPDRVAQ